MVAGFIIGLGAVTVIDIHGFLGRKSRYWTLATIRTHKVTKPLIWIGLVLLVIGYNFLYNGNLLLLQWCITIVMIMNGIFLSFRVSPFLLSQEKKAKDTELLPQSLQKKITVSFIFSFLSWWGSLVLFIDYLLV
mgnify:CR=1 FL=1